MLINARSQIDQNSLTLIIQQATNGAAFSGNLLVYVNGGGWLGNGVVYVTGAQDITGVKRFLDSPRVPYSGTSGSAPSAKWVNDQIGSYSGWAANTYVLPQALTASGATLYALIVNMSGALTGQGGGGSANVGDWNSVYTTGGQSINGVKTFVSSPLVPATIGAPVGGTEATNYNDLISVSGGLQVQIAGGGGGSPNSVTTTGNEVIGGFKQFTGSPFVPYPNAPSGATNFFSLTGASGSLRFQMLAISGYLTGVLTGAFIGPSGVPGPSGAIGPSGATGPIGPTGNLVITGNFVNMSFYFDGYNLATGLNLGEAFVSRNFTFTGYALGWISPGVGPSLTGSLYQRNNLNIKTRFIDFSLTGGGLWYASGGYSQIISGLNRVGVDVYGIPTGTIAGLSIGVFGFGT